jgi:hypothetical protein
MFNFSPQQGQFTKLAFSLSLADLKIVWQFMFGNRYCTQITHPQAQNLCCILYLLLFIFIYISLYISTLKAKKIT